MSNIENETTDPYEQIGSAAGETRLDVVEPPGSSVILHEDGSATLLDEEQPNGPSMGNHFANLAETLDPALLATIAHEFLSAVEVDKQAREKRNKIYEEGLKRTGLGDEAPGGATFPGASRVVHPMLTAACVDFGSRIMPELFPPDGPVKAKVVGTPTNDKNDRAERVARYLNLQLTELMPNFYSEMEMGFPQCSLGGAFYTKTIYSRSGTTVLTVHSDKVIRPWGDGSIYDQPRITHMMEVDQWEYQNNVNAGLWVDVLNPEASPTLTMQTQPERANDKIIGRSQPSENVDNERIVYESSVMLELDDGAVLPYILTVDEQTSEVLAIYRNWKPNDPNKRRLDFLIEWPFVPWRGGVPIGMAHMIGGLSGAATGSLRALLDAAHLNNSQTGVYLKGGATAGGQNIRAQPMQTTTLNGSLAQDDVRKAYMPLPFKEPSPVLFQLLGFLVDAGNGVVRTTFDEFDKFNGQTPVGTANMFIEQGLKNLGAIHSRLHRSLRRFLRQIWDINAETLNNQTVVDQFGELMVTREDFNGPMTVIPVSDPAIFSDMQRQTMAQMIVQRSSDPNVGMLYNKRATELYFLRTMKVPEPEQFLVPQPEPVQQNAVAENAAASIGMPIKAFPGQDHEAHLATHCAYMQSPLFGQLVVIAPKYLPIMLQHVAEHVALWYADAMLDAANAALRTQLGREDITIESLKGTQYEAPLDRMLAELSPEVFAHASEVLGEIPEIVARAQHLLEKMAPQMPMDPSVVALEDVRRQKDKDQNEVRLKLVSEQNRDKAAERKDSLTEKKIETEAELKARALEQKDRDRELKAQENEDRIDATREATMSREHTDKMAIAADVAMNDADNETALEIAKKNAEARRSANVKNGTGIGRGPNP